MYYTTKGLVIRNTQYKDHDSILTILTEDHGVLTANARGVKRKNSRLRSGCQLLTYSEFTLFERNGYYTVNEAEQLQMFTGLRDDLEALALGSYFCQLLETVAPENVADPQLLKLCLNCLYALDTLHKSPRLVKPAFELRLMGEAGFRPELNACSICASNSARRLYLREGILLCPVCQPVYGKGPYRNVSESVLQAMRYILDAELRKLLSFTLPEPQLLELGEVCEAFLLEQLGQSFKTLQFYKSLSSITGVLS